MFLEDPEGAQVVWPFGWADDTTLVVAGWSGGGFSQGGESTSDGYDRYLLDTASPNATLRPDGPLDDQFPSVATNEGTLVSSEPSPDDPAATRFVARALVGTPQPRVLGSVDFAATALDVDSTADNVLFAGVPGAPLDDFGEPIDGVRNPDAVIGYLDADGAVHQIGRDIFWARWIPSADDEPEPEPTGPEASAEDSQITAQAAALRYVLQNNSLPPDTRFDRVLVVDHSEPDAAEAGGDRAGEPGPPFTDEERNILEEAVADLADLEWIGAEEEAFPSDGVVPSNIAVVTLGTVVPRGEGAEVGVHLWCGNVCGIWSTYSLAEAEGAWEVTGTVGPVGIS